MSTSKPHMKGYSIPLIMLIFVVVSHDRPSIFVLFFSVTCTLCTALIFWKFVMDNILLAHFLVYSYNWVGHVFSLVVGLLQCKHQLWHSKLWIFPSRKGTLDFVFQVFVYYVWVIHNNGMDYHSLCYFVSKGGKCGHCWNIFDILIKPGMEKSITSLNSKQSNKQTKT